jgi:hypothetical protein
VSESSVIILVADGVRPDTLDTAIGRGTLPALDALRAEGASHTIVTTFPSVTVAAYTPMLTGRFPGAAGVPGLRWFDRSRRLPAMLGHARSYTGYGIRLVDRDLDPAARTLFEVAGPASLGAMSGITRGLAAANRLDAGTAFALRVAYRHVRGDVRGWLALERRVAARLVDRVRRERPRLTVAALYGADKAAHLAGTDSPFVQEALQTLDATVASLRRDAEHDGRWRGLHLWVVSDHGHAPVTGHDDLAVLLRSLAYRVRAHPWTGPAPADVAVMVSGNAMAHVYVELGRRQRPWWPALRGRWHDLAAALQNRPSVDLLALATSPTEVEVRGNGRGSARIVCASGRFSYLPADGDPLHLGEVHDQSADEILERSAAGPYPDGVVQVSALARAARSGDILLSASPGWDFREHYEPMLHVSSHGALHRDHMRVPLLLNRAAGRRPLRTVDVFPSALRVLGEALPPVLDGAPFM